MEAIGTWLVIAAALMWWSILLPPWRPWSRQPALDGQLVLPLDNQDLAEVTVLIPARNEAAFIRKTLQSLASQGRGLTIILVDDQSTDTTAQLAREVDIEDLVLLTGKPLPKGWSGKLWALEQGRRHVHSRFTLLMDADIQLQPGVVGALRERMKKQDLQFISLMAVPRMAGFWERLLMPAFVYFFKLLYPFRLANSPCSKVAAAAGGCILLETRLLDEIGGFASLRDALIDDCALARRIKSLGYKTWIGLTHSVHSLRPYKRLGDIWEMVARTAFTQLHYSLWLLGLCTLLMVLGFALPLVGLFHPDFLTRYLAVAALIGMIVAYVPTLRFYDRSLVWALAMPLIGMLYLAMTWSSAIRFWRGERSRWKGRRYGRDFGITI